MISGLQQPVVKAWTLNEAGHRRSARIAAAAAASAAMAAAEEKMR